MDDSICNMLQDKNIARARKRMQQLYGDTDPTVLWNATFAAAPQHWPVGSLDALCDIIAPAGVHKLAIVGNGPLTDAQRHLIQASDRVLRFNAVNNMCGHPLEAACRGGLMACTSSASG